MHSSFHLALHSRINSLLAYFKVSFHSPISARARLVSGLSRFFVKKVYIYYEVIRRFSHAPQGCNVVLISRLLQLHLHARYDSSLASARSFLFSILLDSYLDFSLSIEKCYYGRLRVCLSRGVGKWTWIRVNFIILYVQCCVGYVIERR